MEFHRSSGAVVASSAAQTVSRCSEGRWRNRGVDPDTKIGRGTCEIAEGPRRVGKSRRPRSDAIKRSLKKAQEAARERPVAELVKSSSFGPRSESRS